jgi:hypothetical protein
MATKRQRLMAEAERVPVISKRAVNAPRFIGGSPRDKIGQLRAALAGGGTLRLLGPSRLIGGVRYYYNSIVPTDVLDAPGVWKLVENGIIGWSGSTAPGLAPTPLPPVVAAPPRPKVEVIRDDIFDPRNWRKTKQRMTDLCQGDPLLAQDLLLDDKAGNALWHAASKQWQDYWGKRNCVSVPYSFDDARASWLDDASRSV